MSLMQPGDAGGWRLAVAGRRRQRGAEEVRRRTAGCPKLLNLGPALLGRLLGGLRGGGGRGG
jgi:hypothetical protein